MSHERMKKTHATVIVMNIRVNMMKLWGRGVGGVEGEKVS